jgi:hypothetical protein
MAVPDYITTVRKPGDNPEPVSGRFTVYYGAEAEANGGLIYDNSLGAELLMPGDEWYSVAVWQRYAEPVWMDVVQGDVLTHKVAREVEDERHISPLQLTPIRRCIDLWTNPGDVVYDPFGGIGSVPYCAVEMGRKGLMTELKESYFKQAVANLRDLDAKSSIRGLFD